MKPTAATASEASSSAPKHELATQDGPVEQAAAPLVDLAKLALKRFKYELTPADREDLELSEDEDYDSELEPECAWMRTVRYDIVGPKDEIFGHLEIWFIAIEEMRHSFYGEMNCPSHECMEFGFTLFDGNGFLKPRFRMEGTGSWGPEVDVYYLVYLSELEVAKEHRGQGIGSWALQAIWHSKEELLSKIQFLFTRPAPLTSELTHDRDIFGPESEEGEKEREEVQAKLNLFYLKAGFRRVGTTEYSCYARDPSHRSKKIPADKDAEHVISKTAHERAVADVENSQAFQTMLRQWGL